MKDSGGGEPSGSQFEHAFPRQVVLLAASSQRLQPYLYHVVAKCPDCTEVGRYRMIRIEPAHTRDALAAAKARGVVLGATGSANLKRHTRQRQHAACAFSARLMAVLNGFASQGLSRRAMVVQLNDLGIKAPRGGAWSLGQVQRIVNGSEGYLTGFTPTRRFVLWR